MQMLAELVGDGFFTRRADTESARHGRQHESGVLERREADKCDAVGEIVEKLGGNLDGEPRLAGPAGAGQRHEPDIPSPKHVHQIPDLTRAADQGRRLRRQARPRCRDAARRQHGTGHCKVGILIQDLAL